MLLSCAGGVDEASPRWRPILWSTTLETDREMDRPPLRATAPPVRTTRWESASQRALLRHELLDLAFYRCLASADDAASALLACLEEEFDAFTTCAYTCKYNNAGSHERIRKIVYAPSHILVPHIYYPHADVHHMSTHMHTRRKRACKRACNHVARQTSVRMRRCPVRCRSSDRLPSPSSYNTTL